MKTNAFAPWLLSLGIVLLPSESWAAKAKSKSKPKASASASAAAASAREWKVIEKRLKKEKFSKGFVRMLSKKYVGKEHERVLRLNILGFLSQVDHHVLVTDEGAEASKKFLEENMKSFEIAQATFGVDPETIAALLWIETRHGNIQGRFHVPSVYASLVVSTTQRSRSYLMKEAKRLRAPASEPSNDELQKKIRERTSRKSLWAIEQLRALEKIYNDGSKDVAQLTGSFAGAFGIPQFIPSSYRQWAFTDREGEFPNLKDTHDAILSVANYLKKNGWDADLESKRKALYSYNNSRDYVEAILELGKNLKGSS